MKNNKSVKTVNNKMSKQQKFIACISLLVIGAMVLSSFAFMFI